MMTKKYIYFCLIIAVIIGVIGFLYYDHYFDTGEPPLLKEDTLVTRIKPDDPGGILLDGISSVYDQIKSQNHNTKSVTLIPEPELPLVITPPQDVSEHDIIGNIVSDIVENTNAAPVEDPENLDPAKGLKIITSPDDQHAKFPSKKAKSAYYVQVASSRTQSQANKEWVRISKSYNKLLANLEHKTEKYNIANKGAYYRLLIGPLNGSAHAKLICKKLATAKQNCIIKKI